MKLIFCLLSCLIASALAMPCFDAYRDQQNKYRETVEAMLKTELERNPSLSASEIALIEKEVKLVAEIRRHRNFLYGDGDRDFYPGEYVEYGDIMRHASSCDQKDCDSLQCLKNRKNLARNKYIHEERDLMWELLSLHIAHWSRAFHLPPDTFLQYLAGLSAEERAQVIATAVHHRESSPARISEPLSLSDLDLEGCRSRIMAREDNNMLEALRRSGALTLSAAEMPLWHPEDTGFVSDHDQEEGEEKESQPFA